MSSIEGIDKIGEQAAKIEIQGPDDSREPDALEQQLADGMGDGIDSVRISGPNGTTGRDAIEQVVGRALSDDEVEDAAKQMDSESELFDGSAYVAVPEVDGRSTDKLVISFSGSVAYDATDEEGAKMFNDLALGKAVELRVAGFVSGKQGAYKVTATEEEVVTGKAVIKVDTLYLLTPESLA